MNDPGDENDFNFDFLSEEEKRTMADLDGRDASLEAEAGESVPELENPFSPEYLESLNEAVRREHDTDDPGFSERIKGTSLAERLGAVCSGLIADAKTYHTFGRMFEETGLTELQLTLRLSEREQQLICQGLAMLATLSDDPVIADKAYEIHEHIHGAVMIGFAALSQAEIDGRREWQTNDAKERVARSLGFESTEAMREAIRRSLEEE